MKKASPASRKLSERKSIRRTGAPSGPRKANLRRSAMIEAAGKLFVEKGYDATTMDEIAAAAGFAKGTLYYYFPTKADLIRVLWENFEKEVMTRVRSGVEGCPADDWCGKIRAWIDAGIDAYLQMNDIHDVVAYSLGLPLRHSMVNAEITEYLTNIVGEGVSAGAWQIDDERWTAVIMFYSFRGACDEVIMGTQCAEDVPGKLEALFLRMLGVHD